MSKKKITTKFTSTCPCCQGEIKKHSPAYYILATFCEPCGDKLTVRAIDPSDGLVINLDKIVKFTS